MLTPETLIAPGVTPFQLLARPQFQAELVSAWLCSIHHSKPVQWECECVGFICSKVQAACSPLIKYVALQLLKSVTTTHMDCNGDMKLCLRNWSSNQNFTYKGSAAFLSACLHESFCRCGTQSWNTWGEVVVTVYLYFQALLCAGTTSHLPGILINKESSIYIAAKSLLCVSSESICWWIYIRGLVIFTLSPPGIVTVILARQGIISADPSSLGVCSGEGTQ